MTWILVALLVGAMAIAVWAFAAAVHLARVATRAQDEAQATRLALVEALTRAADEQTGKESALRLLDEQMRLRRADLDHLRTELAIQHQEYLRLRQRVRDVLGLDAIQTSRQVH